MFCTRDIISQLAQMTMDIGIYKGHFKVMEIWDNCLKVCESDISRSCQVSLCHLLIFTLPNQITYHNHRPL